MLIIVAFSLTLSSCKKEEQTPEVNSVPPQEVSAVAIQGPAKLISIGNVLEVGVDATDFVFEMNGKQNSFYEYSKDKYVLFNVWGTWCPPCRAELPDIMAISKEQKDWLVVGFAIPAGGNVPVGDQITDVSNFMKKQGMTYLNVVGDQALIEKMISNYGGISGVPTTYYIDKQHKIANKNVGAVSKEKFLSIMTEVQEK